MSGIALEMRLKMNENIFDATLVIYIFASLLNGVNSSPYLKSFVVLTLLHSERLELHSFGCTQKGQNSMEFWPF